MGARPRRAASLRGELEALRRVSDAVPEAGDDLRNEITVKRIWREIWLHGSFYM